MIKIKKIKQKSKKYNSFWRLVGLTTNCGLSAFYYGYCLTYFNAFPFRDIVKIYHIQNFHRGTTQGVLTGIISFTGAIGSILTLFFVDKYSRRKCLSFISFLSIILSLIIMIPNIWVLALVRLVQGLQIGAIGCITPMYINQMMPKSVSAPFWSYHQCLFVLGLTFSFILTAICDYITDVQTYWRIIFGFPILTSVIQILLFIYVFYNQSPKFLVMHDEEQKAKETLRFLYKEKYVERVFRQIIQAVQFAEQSQSSQEDQFENTQKRPLLAKSMQVQPIQLLQIKKQQPKQVGKLSRNVSLNEMLLLINQKKKHDHQHRPPNNRVAVIASFYLSVQQAFMGAPSIINYPGDLIEGIFAKLQRVFPIIINITGIFGALLSIYILAKFGRRPIILQGTLFIGICLLIVFFLCFTVDYQNPYKAPYSIRLSIGLLFIVIRVILSSTFGPIVDLYTNQIIQSDSISALCSFCQWISMGFIAIFFPVMCGYADGNPVYAFGLFGVTTMGSYFFNKVIVLETKNKTEIQIRKQYDQKFQQ